MSEFISQGDLEAVRELLQLVTSNGLGEISVTVSGGTTISIKTHAAAAPLASPVIIAASPTTAEYAPTPQTPSSSGEHKALPPQVSSASEVRVPLASPMVGIFYSSASPGDPPFVLPGDRIQVGQTIGLIEAMKVFSEIPSDVSGRVVEIVVASSDLVQLGQPLLYVEPV